MPRFAILEHDHPALHWDFLLEQGDVLLTWRLSAPPESCVIVEACKSFDHRPFYLDYEGPVSDGRGEVARWDDGMFDWEVRQPGCMVVRLCGTRLRGVFRLEHLDGETWRGEFRADTEGSLRDRL